MSIRKVTFVATLQVKLTAGDYYSSWGSGLALNEVKDCQKKTHFCENEQRFDGEQELGNVPMSRNLCTESK